MTPNDNDMHNGLSDKGLSKLYREAAREEPPMKLDSAVLFEARKAVETNVEKKSWWRRAGWLTPLVSVAVAMLTVSLVLQTKQEHPEALAPAPVEEAAPSLPALKSEQKSKELKKDEVRQREMQDAVKQKPAAPANLMENRSAPAIEETPSPVQTKPAPAPAAAPNKLATPSPARIAEPKQQEGMGRSQMQAPSINRAAGAVAPATGRPAMPPDESEGEKILYPESWIAKIRGLLKQGKKEEAQKEIEAFKAAYPDYELPDDLQSDRPK